MPFREAIGSQLYLATGTRPDIMFAMSYLSQAMAKPTKSDRDEVKRVFRHLKGTQKKGILFDSNGKNGQLIRFSDADFAGDITTRRSTSGVVCMHMNGPVSWSSHKRDHMDVKTTERNVKCDECSAACGLYVSNQID